jgi:hypothetical protein
MSLVSLFVLSDSRKKRLELFHQRWEKPDWYSWLPIAFLTGSAVLLLFALQLGGSKYPWSNYLIIVLLAGFALVLLVLLVLIQPGLLAILKSTELSQLDLDRGGSGAPETHFGTHSVPLPLTPRVIISRVLELPSNILTLATQPSVSLRHLADTHDDQQPPAQNVDSNEYTLEQPSIAEALDEEIGGWMPGFLLSAALRGAYVHVLNTYVSVTSSRLFLDN